MLREARDYNKVVAGFDLVLEGLGIQGTEHTHGTAERAARAWWNELCAGLTGDPPKITTFKSDADEMVVLRAIPIKSVCAHHLLPFVGHATIGYVPHGRILGLSKLARIADYWARRPQVQEELTEQIADAVAAQVFTKGKTGGGVGVVIRARHMCMEMRGVNHAGDMVTSSLRGVFKKKSEARAEFLALARMP